MVFTTSSKREKKDKIKSKIKDQRSKLQIKNQKFDRFITILIVFGLVLIFFSLLIVTLTFFPIIKEEAKYALRSTDSRLIKPIQPINTDFGIVIPKILANAKVIDNVDPYNPKDYQFALTKGVAHARGTAYPGHAGNDFIFAHSSADWFTANKYNSVFYLVSKLEKGDEIDLYYKKQKYVYKVTEKKYVEAGDVSYLQPSFKGRSRPTPTENTSILTLMTCWPPGTTLKRLIIRAKITNK